MRMDVRILVANSFMLIIIAGFVSPIVNAQRMTFGRRLDVHVIRTIITVSADLCMDECNKRSSCGSINYHRLKKFCELNSKTTVKKLNLSIAPGYLFKQKEADHVDQCKNLCGPGKVCSDDKECEFDECGGLSVTNGIAKGSMESVGSKSIVKCDHGYGIEKYLSRASCEGRGWWTNGDKRTCKKICSRPKDIDGGETLEANLITISGEPVLAGNEIDDMLNETILPGSYITYKCKDDFHIYGPATIKCEDGEWSKPPVCFYRPCRLDGSCLEKSLSCSDTVCNCVKDIGNFSMKICVSNCTDELDRFPETSSTTEQPEERDVNEWNLAYISSIKCEQICNRARDFSCEILNPRMFNFLSGNSDNSTCMMWSNSFKDRLLEKIWWNDINCPFKPEEFV